MSKLITLENLDIIKNYIDEKVASAVPDSRSYLLLRKVDVVDCDLKAMSVIFTDLIYLSNPDYSHHATLQFGDDMDGFVLEITHVGSGRCSLSVKDNGTGNITSLLSNGTLNNGFIPYNFNNTYGSQIRGNCNLTKVVVGNNTYTGDSTSLLTGISEFQMLFQFRLAVGKISYTTP